MPALAKKFKVSTKTIKRDIDELVETVPLEIKPGRYEGGVYIMPGYEWDRIYMTDEETALLKMIHALGINGGVLQLDEAALQSLAQIIQTFSAPQKK